MSKEELKFQVDFYHDLKIYQSVRGVTAIILAAIILLSIILIFFGFFPYSSGIAIYLIFVAILTFLTYKGYRWAMIIVLILNILNVINNLYSSILENQVYMILGLIIGFSIIFPELYNAIRVENERKRRLRQKPKENERFCTNCGFNINSQDKFCEKCGTRLKEI